MANPSKLDSVFSCADGSPIIGPAAANIPSYDITWTANEPTAGSTATIADGDVPTVAELGQAVADITAKLNLIITALENHGFVKDA